MSRLVALALLVDGVFQIAGQLPLWPTLADRSLRDQTLFAGHTVAGLALVASAALMNATPARRLTLAALGGAMVIALIETTWFSWPGTLGRGIYSALVLIAMSSGRSSR